MSRVISPPVNLAVQYNTLPALRELLGSLAVMVKKGVEANVPTMCRHG